LRKSLIAAGAAALALGAAGVAYAQNPAGSITGTASVSPTKAGTKSKPKNAKLTLKVTNDAASKTTASSIKITLPSTLKLSTKGLKQCTKSDNDILNQTPAKACKGSIAGTGSANAVLDPGGATPVAIKFVVTPIVGKNQLLFHLAAQGLANKYVLHGKISGKTLTIAITKDVQQPITGSPLYSALVDLTSTLSLKSGKNYLLSSTGCSGGKHKIPVTVGYVPNPTPPTASSASTTLEAKCSK
jgi:hypothetical protein